MAVQCVKPIIPSFGEINQTLALSPDKAFEYFYQEQEEEESAYYYGNNFVSKKGEADNKRTENWNINRLIDVVVVEAIWKLCVWPNNRNRNHNCVTISEGEMAAAAALAYDYY